MTENTDLKVTGKKILEDCVILAKDLGAFLIGISKHAYAAIKTAIAKNAEKKDKKDKKADKHAKKDGEHIPAAVAG